MKTQHKYKGYSYTIYNLQGFSMSIQNIGSSISFKTKSEAHKRAKMTIDRHILAEREKQNS